MEEGTKMAYKILTADDSKMVRMIVTKTLKPHDCEITEASNGQEAIDAARSMNPDLIVLDITMPDMTGFDVLEVLRGEEATKETNVLMLTAESGNQAVTKADELGVSGYVAKPFKPEALLAQVGKILNFAPQTA